MCIRDRVGAGELMKNGCTTCFDHHYVFPENGGHLIESQFEAANKLGIRFHASRGSMDLSQKDGGLPPDAVVPVSYTHLFDQALVSCRKECKELLAFLQQEMKWYMQGAHRQNWMRECCPLHDPLAMVVAVDPALVSTQKRITRIECEGKYCRGMVVTDLREQPITGRYVEHCINVDSEKVLNTLFAACLLYTSRCV